MKKQKEFSERLMKSISLAKSTRVDSENLFLTEFKKKIQIMEEKKLSNLLAYKNNKKKSLSFAAKWRPMSASNQTNFFTSSRQIKDRKKLKIEFSSPAKIGHRQRDYRSSSIMYGRKSSVLIPKSDFNEVEEDQKSNCSFEEFCMKNRKKGGKELKSGPPKKKRRKKSRRKIPIFGTKGSISNIKTFSLKSFRQNNKLEDNPLPEDLILKSQTKRVRNKLKLENYSSIDYMIQNELRKNYKKSIKEVLKHKKSVNSVLKLKKTHEPVYLKFHENKLDLKTYNSTYKKVILQEERAREGILKSYQRKKNLFKFQQKSLKDKIKEEEMKNVHVKEVHDEIIRTVCDKIEKRKKQKELDEGAYQFLRNEGIYNKIWGLLTFCDESDDMLKSETRRSIMEAIKNHQKVEREDLEKFEIIMDYIEASGSQGESRLQKYDILEDYEQCVFMKPDKELDRMESFSNLFRSMVFKSEPNVVSDAIFKAKETVKSSFGIAYRINQYHRFFKNKIRKMKVCRMQQSEIIKYYKISRKMVKELNHAMKKKDVKTLKKLLKFHPQVIKYKDGVSSFF